MARTAGRRNARRLAPALAVTALLGACAGNAPRDELGPETPSTAGTSGSGGAGATTAPPPVAADVPFYTVVQGDTIGKIATKLGVPAQAIVDANGLANANRITVGQKLRIPYGGKAPDGSIVGGPDATPVGSASTTTTTRK